MDKKTVRVAVIDVGTLKSKFEIREYTRDLKSKIVYKDKQLTVLGRDLDKTDNMIIPKAKKKTIKALQGFSQKIKKYNVDNFHAITTEAIRRAVNADQILTEIREKTNIKLKPITQDEEASILFRSISNDFEDQTIAVSDIGGGSVQVVIGKNRKIYEISLFKTGTYFLQEEFSETHHPTKEELETAKKYIKDNMKELRKITYKPKILVYGTTNIIDFLKAMKAPLLNTGLKYHPYKVDVKDLIPIYENITKYSYEDRMSMYPDEPYYMWAADKALMNIFQICKDLDVRTIIPTNNNISSGILIDLAQKEWKKRS